MAGRNHLPPNALELREGRAPVHPAVLIEDPRVLHRLAVPPPSGAVRLHPALVEERIAAQHREIQTLILDNQRLAATHVALKEELAVAQQEIPHLSADAAAAVKAGRDARVRVAYERSLKMEAEVRSIDASNAELAQVRADIKRLMTTRQELNTKLETIDGDLARTRSELRQLPDIKAEIEAMRQEIQRGRAAIEYEKKAHASNLEQGLAMEKNMISLAREMEKLQAELANAEKRARAAAAAAAAATPNRGYAAVYGNPEMGYDGSSYPDPYARHQVQTSGDAGPHFGSAAAPGGPYDMQGNHVQQ